MLKLSKVEINKYKSFLEKQVVEVEENVTVLVGKNESGKTAFLEALAKTNYFEKDENFMFDSTLDYPRRELKKWQRGREDTKVVKCTFSIPKELLEQIQDDCGEKTINTDSVTITKNYENTTVWHQVGAKQEEFLKFLLSGKELPKELKSELLASDSLEDARDKAKSSSNDALTSVIEFLEKIISVAPEEWTNKLEGYLVKEYFEPNMPKFWYFDEYYTLPSRIDIRKLNNNTLSGKEQKISKALFDLAGIDIKELLSSTDFESYVAELEATSNEITDHMFEYWSTNKDLEIRFEVDKKRVSKKPDHTHEDIVLDIRVRNLKHRVTIPLRNRSKGFNWFFSFLVWFSKIQNEDSSNFILLLDEPGLNLHASAQEDLLRFIEDLSEDYQIIYTTHSPFMIRTNHLERVRTVFDGVKSSQISDAIQEKDPSTLFPLQAALGYDIAQNLFVSPNNLLVEGASDLLYLTIMSSILEQEGRESLSNKITIVPVGGLDKVPMFISLLRGSKLNIACLLDSYSLPRSQNQKVQDLVKAKIIKDSKIRFFDEFANHYGDKADIEDVFTKEDYLKIFNAGFKDEHGTVKLSDLDGRITPIILQLNKHLGVERFNHYKPANALAKMGVDATFFQPETLDKFERIFVEVNKLF